MKLAQFFRVFTRHTVALSKCRTNTVVTGVILRAAVMMLPFPLVAPKVLFTKKKKEQNNKEQYLQGKREGDKIQEI